MITLVRFGPAWEEFGCPSQFVLKVETYLRMTGIEFKTKSVGINFQETAPKGKLPYIEHNGQKIADSSVILSYLKHQFGNPLDADLSAIDQAKAHALKRMVEEHVWWVISRERWWAPENPYWDTPGLLKELDQAAYEEIRDDNRRKCNEHGVGTFTEEELDQRGKEDLSAMAVMLGQQKYFLGDKPTSLDATMYAFLAHIIGAPYTSPLKVAACAHQNLVDYASRMKEEWFSVDPLSTEREVDAI